jgi:hypothetical protein
VAALELGHPEDILGAALCVGAVLCALDDRPVWAAVLVGLAIPNKEWALVAIGPVLVALPRRRILALLIAGAVAAAFIAPFTFGAFGGGASGGGAVAQGVGVGTGAIFQPWQLWWWLGSLAHTSSGALSGHRSAPGWVESLTHPLIIAVMPPLTALYAWLGRKGLGGRPRRDHVFMLLALLLALRCVLDPWDVAYYALPFLVALLTWEVSRSARSPVVTLAATLAAWFVFRETTFTALNLSANGQALVFTIVAVPALVALTVACYAPGLGRRLVPRALRARPVAGAAPA